MNTASAASDFPDWELEAGGESLHVVPGMTAIARPQGGTVHTTYKSSAMPCEAGVRVGERFWKLKMIASTDHSLGFLARETAWQWASAHSLSLGWNLQSGYLGEQENVLWLDGNLIALGAVRFQFQAEQPEQAWLITSEDGLIDLVFQPEGVRAEDKNLIIAASRYQQPIGVFNGRVRAAKDKPWREVKNLVGVTENHFRAGEHQRYNALNRGINKNARHRNCCRAFCLMQAGKRLILFQAGRSGYSC
jgi:hypothetical protein